MDGTSGIRLLAFVYRWGMGVAGDGSSPSLPRMDGAHHTVVDTLDSSHPVVTPSPWPYHGARTLAVVDDGRFPPLDGWVPQLQRPIAAATWSTGGTRPCSFRAQSGRRISLLSAIRSGMCGGPALSRVSHSSVAPSQLVGKGPGKAGSDRSGATQATQRIRCMRARSPANRSARRVASRSSWRKST